MPECDDCADGIMHRHPPVKYCPSHDWPLNPDGKCKECYTADAEYYENQRDVDHLWRNR